MKGYQPNLKCKKQVETSSKTDQFILELGIKQGQQCNCEKCIQKYDKN